MSVSEQVPSIKGPRSNTCVLPTIKDKNVRYFSVQNGC